MLFSLLALPGGYLSNSSQYLEAIPEMTVTAGPAAKAFCLAIGDGAVAALVMEQSLHS